MRDTADTVVLPVDDNEGAADPRTEAEDLAAAWGNLQRSDNAYKANRVKFAGVLLAFARKLHDARQTYSSRATGAHDDSAFGDWLKDATHGVVNLAGRQHKDERTAFIYLGTPEFEQHVRDVIGETEARNPRVLAAHVKRRVKKEAGDDIAPTVAQAERDAEASEPETDEAGAADGGSEGEHVDLDPCVDPADALFSLVMLWSEPSEFAEFVQGLSEETRKLVADEDVVQTLRDLADALEKTAVAEAAA